MMNTGLAARPPRFRRCVAGLMVFVVFVASFALATREPALAMLAKSDVAAETTSHRQEQPKPCQKSVLPGTLNTCPLSAFNFNIIATNPVDTAVPALITAAQWQLRNSSLPPQCLGFSPYRPPCFKA